ncbi:rhodanese-like domain-containing protein [Paenibacillus sp. NPDC058071]|uniref:rhodanese-like domain-containing protein n=1 Tax=Paenibacillus sp. NPDC058071 TaxID=3346326 RepID=UPI0036D82E93
MEGYGHVSAAELLRLIEAGEIEGSQIIDVRETFEREYYGLDDSAHIPMNEIPRRLGELNDDAPLYIVCAHGVRSEAVCRYLQEQGYGGLLNVEGGMAAIALLKGFQYD